MKKEYIIVESSQYVHRLTLKDIAAESEEKTKFGVFNRFVWIVYALAIVRILFQVSDNWSEYGWRAAVGSKEVSDLIVVSSFLILWEIVKRVLAKAQKKKMLSGSVRLVCCTLVNKEESENSVAETSWIDSKLHFKSEKNMKSYWYDCEGEEFYNAVIGEEYYVVISKMADGRLNPTMIYPKKCTELDNELKRMLE